MEMRASGDLLQVAAVLYREMLNLGILTIAVTIEFFGAAEDPDHLLAYTVYPNPRRIGIGWTNPGTIELGDDAIGSVCEPGHFSYWKNVRSQRKEIWTHYDPPEAWTHTKSGLGFDRELEVGEWPEPRVTMPADDRWHVTHVPFDHGSVAFREVEYIQEHVDTVVELAASLSLGYVRFLDFQRLEQHNQQLEIDRAVERVRSEATAMRESADIGKVMSTLYDGWRDCGLVFLAGCINIVDSDRGRYSSYVLVPPGTLDSAAPKLLVEEDVVPGLHLYRSLELDLEFARDRGWAQPDLPAALWEAPVTFPDDLEKLWGHRKTEWDTLIGCAGINVPFAHGGLFVQAPPGHRYEDDDIGLVERFADAVSLGYTRFLDLQAAEARAIALTRTAATERVRATVMSMRTTADLGDVVALLWKEMVRLGIRTPGCNIVFLDEEAGRVLEYMALRNPRREGITSTSPHMTEYDEETLIHALDTTLDEYLVEGPMTYSFTLGASRGSILNKWQEMQVWGGDFNEDVVQHVSTTLGMTGLASWDKPGVGTAVAFRYGKIGYNEPTASADHANLVRDLAQALELGYLRFLDFQRLEQQNAEILTATQHKSEFLSRMSHDLRTPMNAIIGYTRLVLRKARGVLGDRQVQNLENIQTSADNLLALINEILDLSRIEAGRIDIHREPVDLRELTAECVASVAPLLRPEVELVEHLETAINIETDPDRVRRIVMNLLGNAVKFTERGSITISLHPLQDGCELAITDTGVGIPSEDVPHIFEEFHQVERTVGPKREGTGLGLAIAQRSAQILGGNIEVVSDVGKGSTFTLRL